MGNQPVTGRRKQTGSFHLHDNFIKEDSKTGDKYSIEEGTIGTGKANPTKIVKGTSTKYTKTGHSSGVAIKLYDGSSQLPADLRAEASILSQCDHPNIVKLFEVTKVEGRMSLVLELCSGGNVLTRMPYKESQVSSIIRQVTSAIAYMHSNQLMHRDIECSNIMFATPEEDSEVKLVDFGSATELQMVPGHEGAFKFLKDRTGSMYVMAPEVIRGKYGPKADVWSIGVCAYTLLMNGKHPIEGKTEYVVCAVGIRRLDSSARHVKTLVDSLLTS
jgi:calcium-dependent protein kinase